MIVRVTRFGKRMTRKVFDLDFQTKEFKAYMKNQKQFIKAFRVSKTNATVVIHSNLPTKEKRIETRVYLGKPMPIGAIAWVKIDSEILLGY